jgi:hypothetical protein
MKNKVVNAITMEDMSIYRDDLLLKCRQLGTNNPKYITVEQDNDLIKATAGNSKSFKYCKGALTSICYQCKVTLPYNPELLYSLITFDKDFCKGWEVNRITSNTMTLTSPYYYKLQSLSKIVDMLGKVNKIEFSRVNDIDMMILEKFSVLNKDVIKELQKKDRGFAIHIITDRENKPIRHVLSK